VSVRADGAYSAMIRIKTTSMKNENKNIEVVIVFMSRKKQTAKKFKKI